METLAHAKPTEVEIELRNQVETALEAGIDVTHIDSHMFTAVLPPFVEIYANIAREYHLPPLVIRPDVSQLDAEMVKVLASILRH